MSKNRLTSILLQTEENQRSHHKVTHRFWGLYSAGLFPLEQDCLVSYLGYMWIYNHGPEPDSSYQATKDL